MREVMWEQNSCFHMTRLDVQFRPILLHVLVISVLSNYVTADLSQASTQAIETTCSYLKNLKKKI